MNNEFKSLRDLYNRIKPALTTRMNELKLSGINYIKEEDIWNFLKENKWANGVNLTISQMVSDIFECNVDSLELYMKKKMSRIERNANFDDVESLF